MNEQRTSERPDGLMLAHDLIDLLLDRQASDVVLLDLTTLSAFADYFVIATADSERHMGALIEALQRWTKERDLRLRQDGVAADGWVLLELPHGVIVHLFGDEERAYYDLEGLWSRAQEVVRIQ